MSVKSQKGGQLSLTCNISVQLVRSGLSRICLLKEYIYKMCSVKGKVKLTAVDPQDVRMLVLEILNVL